MRKLLIQSICLGCFIFVFSVPAIGQSASTQPSMPGQAPSGLGSLRLEDLMNMEVTSVSKTAQKISDAPAAIFVISQDDIERSDLNSIPELLRLAPGLDVARINSDTWAIGSRGFNQQYDRSLLVLMDGRTLYNPASSGVYWDAQDYVLKDLDRIEVIRGPGSTLWGANAVNGVINIESKNAADTQGWLADTHDGSDGEDASVRYGGKLDSDTSYRVYGKYRNLNSFDNYNGSNPGDPWQSYLGGMRIDHNGDKDTFTFEAQGYNDHRSDQSAVPSLSPPFTATDSGHFDTNEEYVLARWRHTFFPNSDLTLQAYYDFFGETDTTTKRYAANTFDLDAQDRFALGGQQQIIWGGGARLQSDINISNTPIIVFDPRRSNYNTYNGFVQDDLAITPDRLHLILGAKLEDDAYTGLEYEPTIGGIWTPNEQNSVWASFSRAIRTPSGFEDHATFVTSDFPAGGGVGQTELIGNNSLKAENLFAYDAGYRIKPANSFSVDLDGFYYDYENLIAGSVQPNVFPASPPPNVILSDIQSNNLRAQNYGLEFAANWQVNPAWRLSGSYSWLQTHFSGGDPFTVSYLKGGSPENQAQLHSYYDITRDLEFNASAYYTDALLLGKVPSYVRLDLGVAWHPTPNMRFSVGVQNLLDGSHAEFSSSNGSAKTAEIPRTVFGEFSYSY